MRRYGYWLTALALASLAAPSTASLGSLFGKKNKPNPAERVPELILLVKTDKDESKRAAAAGELRQYDPAAFKDIVPVLIDVLLNDPKPSVRCEAAESLGKIRPISNEAGWALEQALAKDGSMRVRLSARYALMGYHWAGYHGQKGKDAPAPGKDAAKGPAPARPKNGAPAGETAPPPLFSEPQPGPRLVPRPAPKAVVPPAITTRGVTPPLPPVIGPGPVLEPPKE